MDTGRSIRLVALLTATVVAVGFGAGGWSRPSGAASGPLPSAGVLERQKLRQEVDKLEQENRRSKGLSGFFSSYAALLTALVGVGGVLLTFRAQSRDQTRQRELDRSQRDRDHEQRERESQRQLDERFAAILTDLGSGTEGLQASAAVSLLTFVRPEKRAFHSQVRLVVLASLKVQQREAVRKLLVRVFEAALRATEPLAGLELDLSGASLAHAELQRLDLTGADIGQADLSESDLSGTILAGAKGRKTHLERISAQGVDLYNARLPEAQAARARLPASRLVNAHFEGADFRGGDFRGARMQAAHLEDTDLRGARFEGANLADAYFLRARLDDVALQTLIRAQNVNRAHFSPEVAAFLD
jgi:uncharacterized protein YjbI with pentapeptide repeats